MIVHKPLQRTAILFVLLLASSAAHAAPAPGGGGGDAACTGVGLVPPDLPELHREPFATKAKQLESLFSPKHLDAMDELLLEDLLIPSEFDLIDDLPGPPQEEPWSPLIPRVNEGRERDSVGQPSAPRTSATSTVAKQTVDDSPVNRFTTTVIQVAEEGDPPVVDSLIKVRETSKHEDRWFFYVAVAALCGTKTVGYGSGQMVIDDRWGKNDGGSRVIEVTMKELSVSLSEVEVLRVELFTEHCKFGWYSGKEKSCVQENSEHSVGGVVSADLTLEIK